MHLGADAILLCYDMSSGDSFASLEKWIQQIEEFGFGEILQVVVGCKSDLPVAKSADETVQFVTNRNFPLYFETSSKTGEGVESAFRASVE